MKGAVGRGGGGKERCMGTGCRRVYGVSGKCVGMWGEEWGRCREVCLGVGAPTHFPTSPPSPFHTSPTPQHTFLHLFTYLFPHLPFLPPYPNTFSYYTHISPHLLKVWRSYPVTKFLWQSSCQPFKHSLFLNQHFLNFC